MELKYTTQTTLSPADFDARGNLLPSAVLSLFQDAAGQHGEQMGVGFDAMLAKNLLWVVAQNRYEVLRMPEPGQAVTITTWPLPANRLGFERCYLLCDEQGETLIKGASSWVVIDTTTRRLALRADLYPAGEFCQEKTFSDRARRLQDFEAAEPACTVIPDKTLIDHNGHVNNTHYPTFALRALKGLGGALQSFRIDYIHEVLRDQPLTLYTQTEGSTALVKGETADGTRMFACSFTYQ